MHHKEVYFQVKSFYFTLCSDRKNYELRFSAYRKFYLSQRSEVKTVLGNAGTKQIEKTTLSR